MLLGKEIKKTVWSITFLIFMIALAAFQAAQGGLDFSDVILAEPGRGLRNTAEGSPRIDNAGCVPLSLERV